MLKITNLSVTFGQNTCLKRKVLDNISINIEDGDFVILVGGNGAGKSTLFNSILGQIDIGNAGKIEIDGKNISKLKDYKRSKFTSIVLQDPRIATISNMTIEENLSFAYLRGKNRYLIPHYSTKRIKLFKQKLSQLNMGLEMRLNDLASDLSGGQRQALSLIMATLTKSKILLLDEITAALDPNMASKVIELTNNIVTNEKITTLMITHDMSYAVKYGNKIIVLKDGKINAEYTKKKDGKISELDLIKNF